MDVKRARKQLEARLAEINHSSAVLAAEGTEQGTATSAMSISTLAIRGRTSPTPSARWPCSTQPPPISASSSEALERIDAGTYGQCVDCEKKIPDARLKVRPEVARCVACQQKYEARTGVDAG